MKHIKILAIQQEKKTNVLIEEALKDVIRKYQKQEKAKKEKEKDQT